MVGPKVGIRALGKQSDARVVASLRIGDHHVAVVRTTKCAPVGNSAAGDGTWNWVELLAKRSLDGARERLRPQQPLSDRVDTSRGRSEASRQSRICGGLRCLMPAESMTAFLSVGTVRR